MFGWDNFKDFKSSFLILRQERTQLRIGSAPKVIKVHWEEDIYGSRKRINCPGACCPLCKKGRPTEDRFYVKVIDRNDNGGYLLEFGKMIGSEIKRYNNHPDYGNPTMYDIIIHKSGVGKQTQYRVGATPNKNQLAAGELEELAKLDFDKLVKINTIDEILQMQLRVLPNIAINDTTVTIENDDWNSL